MTPEELAERLRAARARDNTAAPTWFKVPAIGACGRAFIDRRVLLEALEDATRRLVRINAINDNPARFDSEIDTLSTVPVPVREAVIRQCTRCPAIGKPICRVFTEQDDGEGKVDFYCAECGHTKECHE